MIYKFLTIYYLSPDEWFPNEINFGHAEYFLFLLAGLMFLDFLIFLLVARRYTYSQVSIATDPCLGDDSLSLGENERGCADPTRVNGSGQNNGEETKHTEIQL